MHPSEHASIGSAGESRFRTWRLVRKRITDMMHETAYRRKVCRDWVIKLHTSPSSASLTTTTMKLTDKIAARSSPHPFFTLEFFPPRTDEVRKLFLHPPSWTHSCIGASSGLCQPTHANLAYVHTGPDRCQRYMGCRRLDEGQDS